MIYQLFRLRKQGYNIVERAVSVYFVEFLRNFEIRGHVVIQNIDIALRDRVDDFHFSPVDQMSHNRINLNQ